ncbi:hypothetical protein T10_4947 [Trichinella papuae]|uniref:Uncharacterized protein n=1 Tax=Trichinella papuae TaxID=268474 RepID=A0A0V1LZ02_9BILA|nr:hypothetical protein T10_4947 [Trichinella papuae]
MVIHHAGVEDRGAPKSQGSTKSQVSQGIPGSSNGQGDFL